jgi:hypothetical protein
VEGLQDFENYSGGVLAIPECERGQQIFLQELTHVSGVDLPGKYSYREKCDTDLITNFVQTQSKWL